MAKVVIIFAMVRSGGSYLSQVLSGGKPIWTEPSLPDDGFSSTETENVRKLLDFQEKAPNYQVVKLVSFEHYIVRLRDRGLGLPDGMTPICLFRHPYTQVASHLFKFCDWADNWSPRYHFDEAIAAYRQHYSLCKKILKEYPSSITIKYEESLGDGLFNVLARVYGNNAKEFETYALEARTKSFPLGPQDDGTVWKPSTYTLTAKEKTWVAERLPDVMEALGYGL